MEVSPTNIPYYSFIFVNITDDNVVEISERFTLTVASESVLSTASNTSMIVEIQDDDGKFFLLFEDTSIQLFFEFILVQY